MTEFTSEFIAETRETIKQISPLPWKACSCSKCGMITGEKDLIAVATRGNWGDDYPVIKPVGSSIGGQYEVVMEQITYGHIPPETGNANAQYIAEACTNYPKALDHIERLQKRIEELESVNEDQALTISQNDYAYTIDKEMMEKRIAELETYIDDCQSKPCYANKKEEARKKINDILAHALTERKEDYYLDGKYFRLGKLEKDIMEVVDNIFVDGGNENAK